MVDTTKIRRESIRWRLLDTLNKARRRRTLALTGDSPISLIIKTLRGPLSPV